MKGRDHSMLARLASITVLDFETTGVAVRLPSEPWQIGMVRVEQGRVAAEASFESLLRVGDRPFNPHAPGLHHQLRSEISRAPTLPQVWPTVSAWVMGCPLAAHNIGTEKKILRQAAPLHRMGPWIDTLKLVRWMYPGWVSHTLEDVLEFLKLTERVNGLCPGRTTHDALYDAFACAVLLEYFLAQPGWAEVTIEDLAQAHPGPYHQRKAALIRAKK